MRTLDATNFFPQITEASPAVTGDRIRVLQNAGVIAKGERGRYGGVDFDETDAVAILLATTLDMPRGADVAAIVRTCLDLPKAEAFIVQSRTHNATLDDNAAFAALRGLSVGPLDKFGGAFAAILCDLRTGQFDEWANGKPSSIVIEFDLGASRATMLINTSVMLEYGGIREGQAIERVARLRPGIPRIIANQLGPITDT